MVTEVRINGTFITGTTNDDLEEAKLSILKMLEKSLSEAHCWGSSDLFMFKVHGIFAERIQSIEEDESALIKIREENEKLKQEVQALNKLMHLRGIKKAK